MKNKLEKIQSFLIIAISLFLVAYPIHFQYNNLSKIDFLSPDPALETFDLEDQLADDQYKTKIFWQNSSPVISLFSFFSIEQIPRLSFQIFFLDQPTSVLRC
ncbi:MAG: hypothetical protein A2Z51_12010 [Deltaproteobacteria bacterium RBG_19FT_COMBO_52_11]|nr:MAG: hypothetical protein A2Z51_12010 [Deltaproteobacteria bacterium RBG_19FT_COMBO_52_11]